MMLKMVAEGMKPDKVIDLRGKVCPITFVYTKIALEEMETGQTLQVILDYPPSFTNVPHSVKLQKLGTIIENGNIIDGVKKLLIKRS